MTSLIFLALLAAIFFGCVSGNKSNQIKDYKYTEEMAVNDSVPVKIGSWIREGLTCYGIVMMLDSRGRARMVKDIEAEVVSIQPGMIKMKAMEDVEMAPVQGCEGVYVTKGEIWDETTTELFRTREEAVRYLEKNYPELYLDKE